VTRLTIILLTCALLVIGGGSKAEEKPLTPSSAHTAQEKGAAEIPRCTRSLGTIAIVEPDNQWWRELNLESPEAILKVFVQQSGCFKIVNRGRGLAMRSKERALTDSRELKAGSNIGQGQIKAADYFLQPDIAASNKNSGGNAVRGVLGGFMGRPFGGLAGGISVKKAEANVTLSTVNARTTEEEALTEGFARKNDVGFAGGNGVGLWNSLAGAGGGGYQNTEIGKIIVLAYLDAYTKMVAQLGGVGNGDVKRPASKLGAMDAGMKDPDTETPFIPWPPPRPSSIEDVSGNFKITPQFGGIDTQIRTLLRAKGYQRRNYFKVPGGFGVTTEVERLQDNGSPAKLRWSANRIPASGTFMDYVKAFFMGDTGRFRLFVFIVSDSEPMPGQEPAQQYQVNDWTQKGRAFLSKGASTAATSPDTKVWLLVYEFINSNSKSGNLIADNEHSFPFQTHARFLGLK